MVNIPPQAQLALPQGLRGALGEGAVLGLPEPLPASVALLPPPGAAASCQVGKEEVLGRARASTLVWQIVSGRPLSWGHSRAPGISLQLPLLSRCVVFGGGGTYWLQGISLLWRPLDRTRDDLSV